MVSEMVSGTVCKRIRTGVMGGTDILVEMNTFIDEKWRSFYAALFSYNSFNTVLQRVAQGLPFCMKPLVNTLCVLTYFFVHVGNMLCKPIHYHLVGI